MSTTSHQGENKLSVSRSLYPVSCFAALVEYKNISKKTLQESIESEMSGNLEKLLVAVGEQTVSQESIFILMIHRSWQRLLRSVLLFLVKCVKNVPAYLAELLFKSMKVSWRMYLSTFTAVYGQSDVSARFATLTTKRPKLLAPKQSQALFGSSVPLKPHRAPVVWKGMLSHCFTAALIKWANWLWKRMLLRKNRLLLLYLKISFFSGSGDHRVHSDQDTGESLGDRLAGHQSRVQEAVWEQPPLCFGGQNTHLMTSYAR